MDMVAGGITVILGYDSNEYGKEKDTVAGWITTKVTLEGGEVR